MALRADDVDLGRDRSLVERFQAGDQAAFDDLYRRYYGRLTRFCGQRVNDGDAAQEIAQEAFVRAYQRIDTLGGDRRFYPWMTVIASRLCTDHHRRSCRTTSVSAVDDTIAPADFDRVEHDVDLAHLSAAMDRLAVRHRRVLDLREHRGMSYAEIAREMDVTQGVVEQLLHRARRALRREFRHVSGERAGSFVAIAGIASAVGRRLVAWKARMALPGASTTATATAVGVVAVATVVSGVVTSGHNASETPPTVVPAVAETDGSTDRPDAEQPAPPSEHRDGAGPAATDPSEPAPPTGGSPAVTTAVADVFVGREGSATATREAENQEINTSVGPLSLGIDPAEMLDDLSSELLGGLLRR